MLKFLPILCLALVAVTAYDFSDTNFNQYLFEEYESLNSNLLSRQRRDAVELPAEARTDEEPKLDAAASEDKGGHCGSHFHDMMKKDITCCETNKHDPAYFGMIRDTKKQCAMKLRTDNPDVENFDPFKCDHMEKIKELIVCESECVAKSLEMIDENGEIKRDVVIASYKKHLTDGDAKSDVLESYVDKCLNKLKDMELKAENKCNRAPMELQHCLFGEMVTGCPVEAQINSHRCQKIRERYAKGESLALGRHVLHEFLHHGRHHGGRHVGAPGKEQM